MIVPHRLLLAVKCLPLAVAEKTLQERKRLLLTRYSTSPEPTNQYTRTTEVNRAAGWCFSSIFDYASNSQSSLVCDSSLLGSPNEMILIWIKVLSLNMCLEFYRQACLDYDASNIEFHFLSSGGGNFVALGATSIQLNLGRTQQQICT